jgi:hypothetical protein
MRRRVLTAILPSIQPLNFNAVTTYGFYFKVELTLTLAIMGAPHHCTELRVRAMWE